MDTFSVDFVAPLLEKRRTHQVSESVSLARHRILHCTGLHLAGDENRVLALEHQPHGNTVEQKTWDADLIASISVASATATMFRF
jgi:hypothetical protein